MSWGEKSGEKKKEYMFLHYTTYPDNKDPLDKRQTKPRNGPVSSCSWSSQTERQEKSNPVEEECHWESKRKADDQALFIYQGKKIKPLKLAHTGFSQCYINLSVKITILGSETVWEKNKVSPCTYWRKLAWKCHHSLSSAGQCRQSHPVSQSHPPANQKGKRMGGFQSVQSIQQPLTCTCFFKIANCTALKKQCTLEGYKMLSLRLRKAPSGKYMTKYQKATNASRKKSQG